MTVQISQTIQSPGENLWKTIRAFDNVERWNPLIISSKINGVDEGSERICEFQLGDQRGEINENLDSIDEEQKTIKVSVIKAPSPFGGQQIKFQVKTLNENKSEIQISTEVSNGNEQTIKGIEKVFQMMAAGLKKLHEKEVN